MGYRKRKSTSGRRAGAKNLKRVDGGWQTSAGFIITDVERKHFENEVRKANRKRKKMLEAEGKLPRKHAGKDTGDSLRSLQLMGRETDFILSPKSASLQRFKSREQFDKYLANVERVNKPNYVDERIRAYKRNFTKSLQETYGWEASKDIVMKVRMMKPEEYMKLVQSDETLEISYVPSDQRVEGRLNQIRAALGMKLKDEWHDEFWEPDE